MFNIRAITATTAFLMSMFVAVPTLVGQSVLTVDDDGPGTDLWADAFVDHQAAFAVAASYNGQLTEIWVASGTYTPDGGTGDQAAAFHLLDGVAVYGGFTGVETSRDQRDPNINVTVLSGDLMGDDQTGGDNSDNSFHVVIASNTDSSAVLDGFVITSGHANGAALSQRSGGGIYIIDGSPTLHGCVFVENATSPTGGNFGGGGVYSENSNPRLTECRFFNNFAGAGGGMLNIDSTPTLNGCVFVANESFQGGGIKNLGSSPTLVNCVFADNSVTAYGGGLFNSDGYATLTNCTVFNNQAIGAGGGLYTTGIGGITLANCILWNNTDKTADESSQIYSNGGLVSVDYTCVQGWTGVFGGTGNIGDDPLFDNADGIPDSLRLSSGSPCIDAGDNDAVPPDVTTDLAGEVRFSDDEGTLDTGNGVAPIVDMGAFEFQQTTDDNSDGDPDVPENPITLLSQLIDTVAELEIPRTVQRQLDNRLRTVVDKLEDHNPDNDVAAKNKLDALIHSVEAQRGKRIPEADADTLIEAALRVIAVLESQS